MRAMPRGMTRTTIAIVLQTAATRKGNGLAWARTLWVGHRSRSTQVVNSANVTFGAK
jgi:hypothetical protein